jgi:transcriptional regulator with XRE-family HTH domain
MNVAYEKLVGQRLRQLREAQGLTQEQLAARLQLEGCDITRSALAKIEVGQRHLYVDELKLFSILLNVSCEELLPSKPEYE